MNRKQYNEKDNLLTVSTARHKLYEIIKEDKMNKYPAKTLLISALKSAKRHQLGGYKER